MWRGRAIKSLRLGFAVVLMATLLAAGVPIRHAHAQSTNSGLNLTTSPLPVGLIGKPGQVTSTDLRVKNSGNKSEKLQVSLLKFSANNDQGQPRLAERAAGDDYFDWVSFSQKSFTAEPNVWNTIKMSIKIPKDAQLGYYYAVVFARTTENANEQDAATIAGGAATLVLLDVPSPNSVRELKISQLTSKKKVYEFLPADFTLKIQNSGNIHLVPSGTIYIYKGDKQVGIADVNANHGNILPNSDRIFTIDWHEGFPVYEPKVKDGKIEKDKKGNNLYKLNWNFANVSKFRLGKYRAVTTVVYDDGQRDIPLEAEVSFWVIPWRILGGILVLVALIGISVYTIIRKLWHGARNITKKVPKRATE